MSDTPAIVPPKFVVAQFADSDALLAAAKQVREKGWSKIDTHTPYPVHGLEAALGLGRPKIPTIVFLAGLTGVIAAYGMMLWMNAIDFPINVANRPDHSPPSMVPITFEVMVLLGGTSAFFGLMALLRLPQPYHPVFEWQKFVDHASVDGFFLSVEVPPEQDAEAALADAKAAGATDATIVVEPER